MVQIQVENTVVDYFSCQNTTMNDLDQTPGKSIEFNQLVNVTSGKHAGKSGRTFHIRREGQQSRLELKLEDGSSIFVSNDEIDVQFELSDCKLHIPEDQHAEWDALMDVLKSGNYHSI